MWKNMVEEAGYEKHYRVLRYEYSCTKRVQMRIYTQTIHLFFLLHYLIHTTIISLYVLVSPQPG